MKETEMPTREEYLKALKDLSELSTRISKCKAGSTELIECMRDHEIYMDVIKRYFKKING